MAKRPDNTRITQVINPGLDKRIPFGVVNQVIDKATGNLIGYMRGDKFYRLGVSPEEGDKAEKKTIAEQQEAAEKAEIARNETDPFYSLFNGTNTGVSIDPQDGKAKVLNAEKGEVFIYVGPSIAEYGTTSGSGTRGGKPSQDTDVTSNTNYDAIRKKILTDSARIPGGTNALFDKLLANGLISNETYKTRNISSEDFNTGLLYAVRKFSIEAADNYALKGIKKPVNFIDYLTTGFNPSKPSSRTSYDMVVTRRQDAADDADQFFMANLGRNATKEEEDAYYNLLREAEKKAVASTTTKYDAEGKQIGSVSTGELLSPTDKTLLLGKVAGKAIQGSDISTLLSAGGKASEDVDSILSYAKRYGVVLTKEQAMNYVANNFKKGQNLDASKAKILQIAKAQPQYAAIADKISDTVSLQDLAGNYIYNKAQVLELSMDSIDVFDRDIQDGLAGNMTMTDFNKKLRQNPKWATTKNAKEEAANYATDILKSFGLMA
jgi:hypothetical protein